MRLSERGRHILLKLIEKPACTLDELAEAVGSSKKTISAELADVEQFLQQWSREVQLNRRAGEGISLQITERQRNRLLHDLLLKKQTDRDISDSAGRINYILLRLLQAQDYLTVQDFCDELFLSKGTAEKEITAAEHILQESGIRLSKIRNRGMKLEGDERELRNFYAHLVTQQYETPYEVGLLPSFSDTAFYESFGLTYIGAVESCIREMREKYKLRFSAAAASNLVVHIAVALRRVEQGESIEMDEEERERRWHKRSCRIAREIADRLAEATKITLPEDEIVYLSMHLEGTKYDVSNLPLAQEEENGAAGLPKIIDHMLEMMSERYHFDVSQDTEIKKGLLLHLQPAISRMRNRLSISNPCLTEIKQRYLSAFEMGIDCFKLLSEAYDIPYNEDEIAYLAMHIQAMVERNRIGTVDYRVLVVCPFGVGTSQLIVSKLRSHFQCFSALDVMNSVDAENQKLKGKYDFIISTVPLAETDIPAIVVNPVLSETELAKIRKSFALVEDEVKKKKAEAMAGFREETIFFVPDGLDLDGALQWSCDMLAAKGYVEAGFYASVKQREQISSTSYGIWAIPHGSPALVRRSCIALCISKTGIVWGENTVKIFFLLALNKDSRKDFSAIFDSLYSLTCDYHLLTGIMAQETREGIVRLLQERGYSV